MKYGYATWDHKFAEMHVTLRLEKSWVMTVEDFTIFKDKSKRSNYRTHVSSSNGLKRPSSNRRRIRRTIYGSRMKITNIQTHVCHARMRNWIFVKVLTDQDGLFGWGEATLEWHTRAWSARSKTSRQLLVGEDPTRIEHLWQMMFRQHFWHGNGIVRGTAIAGIDLALWDILGKVAGRALRKLWGGPVRDHVRTYCHLGGGRMEDFYETAGRRSPRVSASWRQAVRDGFTAFKSMARAADHADRGLQAAPRRRACVAAMREAVGDAIDIMVDCHARPVAGDGLAIRPGTGAVRAVLSEEPCWPESVDGLAASFSGGRRRSRPASG